MANKQKKKRTKKYQGVDARATTPSITRVSAEERSALKEWWLKYRQLARVGGTLFGVVAVLTLLIIGIIGLF